MPHLTTLVLTQNNLTELADLEPLRSLTQLTHLTLLENPITRKEVSSFLILRYLRVYNAYLESNQNHQNYRYWVIWLVPSVRFLDYQKVKDAERNRAKGLFGTMEEPSALASKIMGIKTRAFDATGATLADRAPAEKAIRVKLTDTERKRVEKMIREAKSLQEIIRLEKELNEGRIPGGALGGEDADGDVHM